MSCASSAAPSHPETGCKAAPRSNCRSRLMRSRQEVPMEVKRSLLIVDDDASFSKALRRSFERRDYRVHWCEGIDGIAPVLAASAIDYAVVDLKLIGGSGLECVKALHEHDPDMRIVVLTGFASIATAVEAIKLGACHYLAKPSNTDDIEAAFDKADGDSSVTV